MFGFGRPLRLNFNDSQCLFSELPRQLPLMEFLPLRATCKLYSKTEAFQKLLAVKWPKQALAAARQKHLSAEELLTFPKVRSSVMGGKTRSHFYGFCCPEDRRKLDRFCGTIDMPSTMCKSVFINKVDDSYETMHEARFYRARSERGWGSFQSFVWGLGNWAALALFWKGNVFFHVFPPIVPPKLAQSWELGRLAAKLFARVRVSNPGNVELCCFGGSVLHKLVDTDCCIPSTYDEEELVI